MRYNLVKNEHAIGKHRAKKLRLVDDSPILQIWRKITKSADVKENSVIITNAKCRDNFDCAHFRSAQFDQAGDPRHKMKAVRNTFRFARSCKNAQMNKYLPHCLMIKNLICQSCVIKGVRTFRPMPFQPRAISTACNFNRRKFNRFNYIVINKLQ